MEHRKDYKEYDVVAAVIVDNDRVLCVRKGVTRFAYTSHHWEFPGGKIEIGETPQQALKRELLEEMDLDVVVVDHLITVRHRYPDFAIILRAYVCKLNAPHLLLREHEAMLWADASTLSTLRWCAADEPIAQAASCYLKQ